MAEKTIPYLSRPDGTPRTLKCTLATYVKISKDLGLNMSQTWLGELTLDNFHIPAKRMLEHEDPDVDPLEFDSTILEQLLFDMVEVSMPRRDPRVAEALTITPGPSADSASD